MSPLRVHLFGRLCIFAVDGGLVDLESAKAQELLCYLLVNHVRPHHRETLADQLFRTDDSNHSKNYLRKALWQLQAALARQTPLGMDDVLLVDAEWIQFNASSNIWVDLHEFESSYLYSKKVSGQSMQQDQMLRVQSAVDLYRGSLLEGSYANWCLFERERLQFMYLAMLDRLIDYCMTHAKLEEGINYAMQALSHDATREHTHRRLMQLHYFAGDRATALRQYERCISVLADELGVPPSAATAALHDHILNETLLRYGEPEEPTAKGNAPGMAEIVTHLTKNAASLHNELLGLLTLVSGGAFPP